MKNLNKCNMDELEQLPFRSQLYCIVERKDRFRRKGGDWSKSPDGIVWHYLRRNQGKDIDFIIEQFKNRHPNLIHELLTELYYSGTRYNIWTIDDNNKLRKESLNVYTANRQRKFIFESHDYESTYCDDKGREMIKAQYTSYWYPKSYPFCNIKRDRRTIDELTLKVISGFSKEFDRWYDPEFVRLRREKGKILEKKHKKEELEKKEKERKLAEKALAIHSITENLNKQGYGEIYGKFEINNIAERRYKNKQR